MLLGWSLFLELNAWVHVRNAGSEEQGDVTNKKKTSPKVSIMFWLALLIFATLSSFTGYTNNMYTTFERCLAHMEHKFLSSFIKIIFVRVWSSMYNLYVSAQYYD